MMSICSMYTRSYSLSIFVCIGKLRTAQVRNYYVKYYLLPNLFTVYFRVSFLFKLKYDLAKIFFLFSYMVLDSLIDLKLSSVPVITRHVFSVCSGESRVSSCYCRTLYFGSLSNVVGARNAFLECHQCQKQLYVSSKTI